MLPSDIIIEDPIIDGDACCRNTSLLKREENTNAGFSSSKLKSFMEFTEYRILQGSMQQKREVMQSFAPDIEMNYICFNKLNRPSQASKIKQPKSILREVKQGNKYYSKTPFSVFGGNNKISRNVTFSPNCMVMLYDRDYKDMT